MGFRQTKDGLWVNVAGDASGPVSPFSPDPMPGVDWSEFRRTGVVKNAVPPESWRAPEARIYPPARKILTRWIVAGLVVIALGQGCQLRRVLRAAEPMRVGQSLLQHRAASGWLGVADNSQRADDYEREYGRILGARPLAHLEMFDQGNGSYFDAYYRLECELGSVDIHYGLRRSGRGWREHSFWIERGLQNP